ncbi:DNA polymerase I, partial [Dehalococcoidia bacterium]|nr:DNA polymerase I [Dehalococcoidia bacterium]
GAYVDMTWQIYKALEPILREVDTGHIMPEIEIPLVPILVDMQYNGIITDHQMLRQMSGSAAEEIDRLKTSIYTDAGQVFNINSPQQLGVILFEKLLPPAKLKEMGLPLSKHTKTGYSTDASVLEALKGASPVVDQVLRYRELNKLKSTYLDSLPGLVNPNTGRIHTRYNQVGSATGRFSSSDPNLQNIPIRTEQGRQVRHCFRAQRGWFLLSADYSQVELRILAHFSQDPGLLSAFNRDEDIHTATASQVYGVSLNEVTPSMRRLAKVMNFGIIYGLSPHGMTQQTDLPFDESAAFINSYFGKYPGIHDYMEQVKELARKQGYVETLLGRRRYIPEISHTNFNVRQAAERIAINMPIQGTAADIIKVAMVQIHRQMRENPLTSRSRMLLQVHDELIFEVPPEEIDVMKATVLQLMPSAIKLTTPLRVDLKIGPTWGTLE